MVRSRRSPPQKPPTGGAVTLRLGAEDYRRLSLVARTENRNPTNYVETLVLRDIAAREEASRVITMLVPADVASIAPGVLLRTEGDSDARHAERVELFDRLFDLPDAE